MSNILVTYSSNWADEFDVISSLVMTKEEWETICEDAKSLFKYESTISHYVGSNQEISYNLYKDWFACYKVTELTEQECEVLTKFNNILDKSKFFIPEFYVEDYEDSIEVK